MILYIESLTIFASFNVKEIQIFSRALDHLLVSDVSLTTVWKQEWRWTRKGGFPESAKTLFSIMVHSTSSSWMMTSFLRILIANNSEVPFRSANMTFPKDPLPRTIRKLKFSALITSLL